MNINLFFGPFKFVALFLDPVKKMYYCNVKIMVLHLILFPILDI